MPSVRVLLTNGQESHTRRWEVPTIYPPKIDTQIIYNYTQEESEFT
jgi:hypothetical protein